MGLTELMERFLLYIYRMSYEDMTYCAVIAALIFCTLFRKYAGQRWLRPCIGAALSVWLVVVLWMTMLSRSGGGTYRFSLIPLHTYWRVISGENQELLRSAFMNVALFYPAGLLLASLMPEKWSFRKGLICTGLVLALLSLTIELGQYVWQLGNAEIDDVLHNTLGAGVGCAAFRLDLDGTSE